MKAGKVKPNTQVIIAKQEPKSGPAMTTDGKVVRMPGRPVVEGSKRQIELAEKAKRREDGTMKKGRPIDEGSKKQQREADLAEKKTIGIGGPGWTKSTIKKAVDAGTIVMTKEQKAKYLAD